MTGGSTKKSFLFEWLRSTAAAGYLCVEEKYLQLAVVSYDKTI